MKVFIEPIGRLINEFTKLPGVGAKTAQRYAYKVINMSDAEAEAFAASILDAKKKVHYCKICGNFAEGDICDVCKARSAETICVVKEPKDYGRENSPRFAELCKTRKNEYISLGDDVRLISDLSEATKSDVFVVSIKSGNLRDLLRTLRPYGLREKTVVLCMKGLEEDTGKRLSVIAEEEGADKDKIAVWVGPGHIQAFAKGLPNCMLIDSANRALTKTLADAWRSDLIRFYYGDDIIGSEVGAAAKNVFGIAAGMLDGGGYSTLKGPLMARGAREISRLIKAMGGNELSAYGLCHLGDYETTLFSEFSNNRAFGMAYVRKENFAKLAEGVFTAKGLKKLGEQYGEELPITNAVYSILYENKDPMEVFLKLFSRSTRAEF